MPAYRFIAPVVYSCQLRGKYFLCGIKNPAAFFFSKR
jgi:hypothetical protein